MRMRTTLGFPPLLFALLILTASQPAAAAEFDRHFSLEGNELKLINLIGEIQLEGYNGSTFEIDVAVRGSDASADLLEIEAKENGKAVLAIRYPAKKNRFVYPRMGRGSSTTLTVRGDDMEDDWLGQILPFPGKDRIQVSGSGRGLEIYADIIVKIPTGSDVTVHHGVGDIEGKGLEGRIVLDTVCGGIKAEQITGELVVDTGSGSVEAREIDGDLNADTGSGGVRLSQCTGETMLVDTGSGSVEADEIACEHLNIDTGSGSVKVRAGRVGSAKIDTGSGSVRLSIEEMGAGSFLVDTGSGSIDLRLPEDASADLIADTGNGGISWNLPEAKIGRKSRDEVAIRLGAGAAHVRLDTGSGAIRIHH